jgi:transposase
METITLDRKQQAQARVLNQLLEGRISTGEAAASLGKSIRWVEGKRPVFRREGVEALVHGNTGKVPWNAAVDAKRAKVLALVRGKYAGFNFQQLTEKLNEDEGVKISPSTLRRYCLADGITPPWPQKRRRLHRKRRERRRQEGELLQLDGSPHDWLEGRGPRMTLINFIDDATGKKWREFREGEDLEGYMRIMWRVIEENGVPGAIYTDRTVIVAGVSQKYRALTDEPPGPSQLGRALGELGVAIILANSAQAKGRVERTHGTDQDRLVSELRLAKACTLDDANAVLKAYDKRYGRRFTVAPADTTPAWRPRPDGNLADVFCIKEARVVANDNTVRCYGRIIDIPPGPAKRSYAGSHVQVYRRYDGTTGVFLEGRRIGGDPARSKRAPRLSPPPNHATNELGMPQTFINRPQESLNS